MFKITYFSSILQSITEALPLSSSLHLKLCGITNSGHLDCITASFGLLYILCNGTLVRYLYNIIKILISTNYRMVSKISVLSYIAFIISMLFVYIRITTLLTNEASVIAMILGAIWMYIADLQNDEDDSIKYSIKSSHIAVSILANMIALIPGTSRLGSVYTAMRMTGLNRRTAIQISIIQGLLVHIYTIAKIYLGHHIIQPHLIFMNYPVLLCGFTYLLITILLFNLRSKYIHIIITSCALYRVCILPFLYMNFL